MFLLCGLMFANSAMAITEIPNSCLTFEACVDGSDWVKVENNQLSMTHGDYSAIGSHNNCSSEWQDIIKVNNTSYPITLDGSKYYINGNQNLGVDVDTLTSVEMIDGRGSVTKEGTSAYLNDNSSGGGAVYKIKICGNEILPAPTLKLTKVVNGGNGTPADWELRATNGDSIFSNLGNSDSSHSILAGMWYRLSESVVQGFDATGYSVAKTATNDDWSCTNGSFDQSTQSINLNLGDSAVCTITNTYNECVDQTTMLDEVTPESIGGWTVNDTGNNPIFSYKEIISPYDKSTAIETSVVGNTYQLCPSQSIAKTYIVSGNTDTADLKAYLAFTSTMDEYNFPYVQVSLFDNADTLLGYQVYYGKGVISGLYASYAAADPAHYTELSSANGDVTLDLSKMGNNIDFSKVVVYISNYACVGENSITFDHLRLVNSCGEENIPPEKCEYNSDILASDDACTPNEIICDDGQELVNNECVNIVKEEPTVTKSRSKTKWGSRIFDPSSRGQVLGAETSCGIYVDKFLKKGLKGNDTEAVKKVQTFLNTYMASNLTVDGKMGTQTDAALKAFQAKHADKVLAPWGLVKPTGIFYLTSQTEVNNIMCPALGLPIPELVPTAENPLFPKA